MSRQERERGQKGLAIIITKLQRLYSLTRQAIDDYQMISPGNHIAIGVSGGKGSLTLLYILRGLRRFYPNSFELLAVAVDLDFQESDFTPVKELCEQLSVLYTVVSMEVGKILSGVRKESNPCALCAKMQKDALNQAAKDLGCNKIVYAHHKDDSVETMLLSLIYEGRFYAFPPYTYLDRMDLSVIRPLMYANEANVIGFKNKYEPPVCKSPCPVDGHTKREYIKLLMGSLEKENPDVKECVLHIILNGSIDEWPGIASIRR